MTSSPFPGMDPFLEVNPRWEGFHGWFMRELTRQALPRAEALGCWIDVEKVVWQEEEFGAVVRIGKPDQLVGPETTGRAWQGDGASVALATPRAVHENVIDPETIEGFKQEYLVIRELGKIKRVLAVVELLSPGNKAGVYRDKYLEKRRKWLISPAHFMEIDFLRGGHNPSRDLFPELEPTPYFIFVARKGNIGRNEEGYSLRLQDRLPTVGLPLGPPRPDLPLDLAAAFQAAYPLAVHHGDIDYATESVPPPPLTPEDAAWVRDVVKAAKPT
jgi:uncharacterized protein DUF4058